MRNWQEDMELCEKATRGPWEIKETQEGIECPLCGGEGEVDAVDVDGDGWGVIMQSCGIGEMIENNARFTITAREALPYWLNAYRELEAKAAAMREKLELVQFPGSIGCTLPDDYKFTVKISAGEFRAISDGLSSTAGKALLDRLRKAEARVKMTRQEWMDKMDEVEVLTYLIALLYHYDVGTERFQEENFEEKKWNEVREAALNFFETRLGEILSTNLIGEFYKKTI